MYRRILIVLDDQPACQTAIRHGVEMARVHGAEVVFLYVLPHYSFPLVDVPPLAEFSAEHFNREARETASRVLKAATDRAEASEVHSQRAMGSGTDPAVYVAEAASKRQCEMIVVATEGRNAVMRIISGSIVPGLITNASVPVMVCRQDEGANGTRRRVVRRRVARRSEAGPLMESVNAVVA